VSERRLLEHLASREDELIELARRLVATRSVNPPGDERAVAAIVTERLAAHGIVDVVEHAPGPERPSLLARVGGDPGRTLMLCGHLDTKPPGDLGAWRTDPWDPVVEDGELHGLGSGDMKGAVAAMVEAAAALRAVGLPSGTLVLALVADEEAGSTLGARWLAEQGLLQADAAVIGEPGGVMREWEAIDLVSRGAALFKVRVHGTQMHSSLSDRLPAVNATVAMARLAERMHRELHGALTFDPHPLCPLGPTVNVGVMAKAGIFYGVHPGEAELACDIRILPGMTRESVETDLRAFLARAAADDPELDAELVMEFFVPATEISPDEPIVRALQEAAELVLDAAPGLAAFPGATDAAHLQGTAGIPTVASFGPGFLPRAHSPNESVSVSGIVEAARMYALAAYRYLDEEIR
jgi:acetylornithine deacetylase/succinyl-diaminopimelate desuccinylase-like protein